MNNETVEFVFKAVEFGIVPFIAYVIKKLTHISEELKALRTVLIGIDGRNGIRSRLIHLERRLERISTHSSYNNHTDEMGIGD